MPLHIGSHEPRWRALLADVISDISIAFGGIGIVWCLFHHGLDVLAAILGTMLFARLDYDFIGLIYTGPSFRYTNIGSSGRLHWTEVLSKMINAWGMVAMIWMMGYYKCYDLIGIFGVISICQFIMERRWRYDIYSNTT